MLLHYPLANHAYTTIPQGPQHMLRVSIVKGAQPDRSDLAGLKTFLAKGVTIPDWSTDVGSFERPRYKFICL